MCRSTLTLSRPQRSKHLLRLYQFLADKSWACHPGPVFSTPCPTPEVPAMLILCQLRCAKRHSMMREARGHSLASGQEGFLGHPTVTLLGEVTTKSVSPSLGFCIVCHMAGTPQTPGNQNTRPAHSHHSQGSGILYLIAR